MEKYWRVVAVYAAKDQPVPSWEWTVRADSADEACDAIRSVWFIPKAVGQFIWSATIERVVLTPAGPA